MLLSYADRCCHQNAMYKPDAESEPVKTKELGGWAEYALGLETQVGLMPSNICLREAGSLPKVALTSYKALVWHCDAPWGGEGAAHCAPIVVILGGSSGCGTCAIQMARAWGASEVITTCSAKNAEYCSDTLQATRVIDYTSDDWAEVLGAASVDVVYDCIGEAGCADKAMAVLRPGGRFVSIMGQKPSEEAARDDVQCATFINSVSSTLSRPCVCTVAVSLTLQAPPSGHEPRQSGAVGRSQGDGRGG